MHLLKTLLLAHFAGQEHHDRIVEIKNSFCRVHHLDRTDANLPTSFVHGDLASQCAGNNLMSKTYADDLLLWVFIINSFHILAQLYNPRLIFVGRMACTELATEHRKGST